MSLASRLGGTAAAALLLLSVAACTTDTDAGEQTHGASQTGYVGSTGNLTRFPPADRVAQPSVSGTSLDGRPLSTADYAGRVVVVNVWGSWCPPCRQEAPGLQRASEQTAEVAQFVGINTQDSSPTQAQAFVRAHHITFPSIYDPDGKALLAFARTAPAGAIPTTLVIDRQGRLAVRVLGTISERSLVDMVTDVAAGK